MSEDHVPGNAGAGEDWRPPVGPVDPEHPECAAVIAEVGHCSMASAPKPHETDCESISRNVRPACGITAWRTGSRN